MKKTIIISIILFAMLGVGTQGFAQTAVNTQANTGNQTAQEETAGKKKN